MGSKKDMAKEPVKLRVKMLANGNKSIYLDWYSNGRREYEFLKLYLIPEKNAADKAANAETLRLANAVKAQRIVEIQNAAHGFSLSGARAKVNLIEYIKNFAEIKREKSGKERGSYQNYLCLARQIKEYSGTKTAFRDINKSYCHGFLKFLEKTENLNRGQAGKPLNENTRRWYLRLFETVLNAAISDSLISINPFKFIKSEEKPVRHKAEICYLTIDEVKTLENTPCLFSAVKQAFLFSCFSGLRYSDICNLTWNKLQKDSGNNIFINFIQKKTKKQEYLPLPKRAISWLPEKPVGANDNDFIFKLPHGGYVNLQLRHWAFQAGISKHIHFHVARHTYATLLLTLEVPIETVSKNLGHSEIRTTQIYAKVINAAQRAAADRLDTI
ncbi:MAG: site-specific integrase [Prevotellaceae bacterium]|jgi:integrase|nr:site-specific integrase [Prevotellaceae bacterium]